METLADKIKKLKDYGKTDFPVRVGIVDLKCRTLSSEEESDIHMELQRTGYAGYAYWYTYKIFKVAKCVKAISGEDWPASFDAEAFGTNETNAEIYLRDIFWTWDDEMFKLLYRVLNAKMKLFAGKLVEENGIEKFLGPEELKIYEKMQLLDKIETEIENRTIEEIQEAKDRDKEITSEWQDLTRIR